MAILCVGSFTQAQTTYSDTGTPNPIPTGNITTDAIFDITNTATYSKVISGSGYVTKTGSGTLTFSGANTFSGNLTISGGKLNASSGASLGSNSTGRTVTVGNGAELVFTVNNVITNAHNDQNVTYVLDGGRISNSGSVYNYLQNLTVKDGATIYAANGLSDWKAFKLHNVNVVRNSDDSSGAAVVFSASSNANATFAFGANSSTIQEGTSSSTINVAEITSANASVNDNVSDLVISAVIADPLYATGSPSKATKIVKTGAGTLEISGSNTFTGPLVVEEGTLKVSKSTSLGANSAGKTITVGSGGEIVLAVSNVFTDAHNDQNVTYILDGGRISNSGAVYNYLQNLTLKDGASVYASDGHSPWNAYKFFNVSVERNSDGTAGEPVVFSADMNKEHATFAFGAKSSEAGTKTAVIYVEDITSSNAAVVDNVSDLVISGIIADTLTNSNGTTAAAPIEKTGAGTLEFTATNTYTGTTTISGGTLKLSGAGTLGTGDVTNSGTLEFYNSTATIAPNISGAGDILVSAGTATLSGAVTQTGGATTLADGTTLNIGNASTLYNLAVVDENASATLNITGNLTLNNSDESTFIGSITAQKITVNTANDVALKLYAGANNKVTADSLTVSSGELDFKGYFAGNIEVFNGSVFSPGNSIGEADITGDITFTSATADSNGVAWFEFGEYADGAEAGVDYDLFVMQSNGTFTADDGVILLDFANHDADSWAAVGNEFQLVSGGGFDANVDYNPWLGNMTDLFKLEGRTADGLYLIGIKAAPEPGSGVPEPSTWALLALGVVVLFLRKRVRN